MKLTPEIEATLPTLNETGNLSPRSHLLRRTLNAPDSAEVGKRPKFLRFWTKG